DTDYVMGVGLAAMIFSPLMPHPGDITPVIPSDEADVISYPNPFNPDRGQTIEISYKLAQDAEVKIYIFDITGQLIRTIVTTSANRASDGYSRYAWDGKTGFGSTVDNGVYLVKITSGGKNIGKTKIMVVK
ncbi:MAG: T9SS type A sorting domain-containing protein, partial [Candidatus Margulisbacteria bacterium]|nr:T9SS type A sorting domain-containing protein [Candidatus Margulisiibacteriota bacterium]